MSRARSAIAATHRVTFTEHVLLDERTSAFADAFREMLERLERDTPGLGPPVRITVVRRMLLAEVERLRLEPASGRWFEVRGDAQQVPRPQSARAGRS